MIEREVIHKKFGKHSLEVAFGITSRPPEQASPENILSINRGHWIIENSCHYIIDWNYDEDRCRIRIRTGNDPENITRLRRFAVGVLKLYTDRTDCKTSVAEKIRQLGRYASGLRLFTHDCKFNTAVRHLIFWEGRTNLPCLKLALLWIEEGLY